jgi:anthranilate synthase component 2
MGVNLTVFRNTVATHTVMQTLAHYHEQGPTLLMLSPGPGAPSNAGNMPSILEQAKGKYPVLGICLGHQAIVESYQGKVARARQVMHGKSSMMQHNYPKLFKDLPSPMSIARYHSLVAIDVPECLQIIAHIDTVAMAVLHHSDKMLGFQFHPESVLTSQGSQLLLQAIEYLLGEAYESFHISTENLQNPDEANNSGDQ